MAKRVKEYPEKILNAFLTEWKPIEIQKKAGISRSYYYKLKADADFQKALTDRRSAMVKDAVLKMEGYLSHDVEILQSIIEKEDASDQVRVNAINALMNQLSQWRDSTEIIERIQALEDAQKRSETI